MPECNTRHRGRARGRALAAAVVMMLAIVGQPSSAPAHALAPALLELVETGTQGTVEVLWRRSYQGTPGVVMTPALPGHCRPLGTPVDKRGNVTMDSRWRIDCGTRGLRGSWIGVAGIEETKTDALLRVAYRDGSSTLAVLRAEAPRLQLPEKTGSARVAADYIKLGVDHILHGFDHLLLLLCLLWLIPNLRMLLAVLSSFTAGHTVTLALAMVAVQPLPQAPIEAAIAASVLLLAVEAAGENRSRWIGSRPWIAAGVFGLLHGLGFAGALRDIGLPSAQIPVALLSFNVGIELGQILFVAGAGVCLALARRLLLPLWVQATPVYVAGSLAAMWTIERTVSLW